MDVAADGDEDDNVGFSALEAVDAGDGDGGGKQGAEKGALGCVGG